MLSSETVLGIKGLQLQYLVLSMPTWRDLETRNKKQIQITRPPHEYQGAQMLSWFRSANIT
jgi:hypothetical protein